MVARMYLVKLLDLQDFLIKKGHLGKWHICTCNKRGLLHDHFLLVMKPGSKLKSLDDFHKYISAEIPDLNSIRGSAYSYMQAYDAWSHWYSQ